MSSIEKAMGLLASRKQVDTERDSREPLLKRPGEGEVARKNAEGEVDLQVTQRWMHDLSQRDRESIITEYRRIKRPIIENAFGKNAVTTSHPNLVMITSSVSGEGKSFTSVNLAHSIALEMDYTVLLVDADVVRKSVSRQARCEHGRGLMDVLAGDIDDLGSVVRTTNVPRLKFLPAGTPHERAPELIASHRMEGVLHEISRRYSDRLVIFDAPPLLATVEAQTLARSMGQIILVVEAGRTQRVLLKAAIETLDKNKPILAILNKSLRGPGADSYGGYYYGPSD